MTPERWARLEALFDAVVDLPPPQRAALLRDAGADADIVDEVISLLSEHDEDPAFLEDAPGWLAREPAPQDIAGYTILEVTGHGGMGTVYRAERMLGDVTQRVALKVLRRGLGSDELVARFRAERRILARLEHAAIARLVDAGTTDGGQPFFAMEHVDGVPITEYAEAQRCSVRRRVELFQAACAAVQHAHGCFVVHGDIKPAHVLVTADGSVKLLDFGIARLLDAVGDDDGAGLRMLTPGHAAPEQVRGDPITTASDVYGLGVLLYQLLAGAHPYGTQRPRAVIEQLVLDTDPPPPSAAAADARRRRTLRGDLDAIVLRAMQREPARRYASALSLSEDLDRWLHRLPVQARPQSPAYVARRFVRRHATAVAAALLLFLVLTGSTVLTSRQAQRIREESARVASERDKALQVRTFLLEMFGATGPDQPTGDAVTARQLLDRQAATLEQRYADPAQLAEMLYVLAEGYEKLGLTAEAEPLARRSLDVRRASLGADHPDVVASLSQLGWILQQRARLEPAETLLRSAVATGDRIFPAEGHPLLARALNDLGVVREARGDYGEAVAHYTRALAMRRALQGDAHLGTAITTSNLSVVLYRQGDLDGAAAYATDALRLLRAIVGPDHQRTTIVQNNLAAFQAARGDHAGAAAQHREILERRRRLFGPAHPQVAYSMTMLAGELLAAGDVSSADSLASQALQMQRAAAGNAMEMVATHRVLGDVQRATGRHGEALRSYDAALRIVRSVMGPAHRDIPVLLARRATVLEAMGDAAGAAAGYSAVVAAAEAVHGSSHVRTLEARLAVNEHRIRTGRPPDDAELDGIAAGAASLEGALATALRTRVDSARARLVRHPR